MVKIRLTRIGRHKDPFFRVVAADSHYARDGRIIEQIGYYDPAKGIESAVIDEEFQVKQLKPCSTAKALTPNTLLVKKKANRRFNDGLRENC